MLDSLSKKTVEGQRFLRVAKAFQILQGVVPWSNTSGVEESGYLVWLITKSTLVQIQPSASKSATNDEVRLAIKYLRQIPGHSFKFKRSKWSHEFNGRKTYITWPFAICTECGKCFVWDTYSQNKNTNLWVFPWRNKKLEDYPSCDIVKMVEALK